jgi:hypothetical protein
MTSADGKSFNPETYQLTAMDGKTYSLKVFLPARAGIYIAEMNQENISTINQFNIMIKIVALALQRQFDFMTEDWLQDNVSYVDLLDIYTKFMQMHATDMAVIGSESLERVKPAKKLK